MFERYTEKARRTIFFARFEASQFGSLNIETEHLLLGILRENHHLVGLLFKSTSSQAPDLPPDVAEAESRIALIQQRMENALANHEFEKANFYSDEERIHRAALEDLRKKHGIADNPSPGLGGPVESIRRQIEKHVQRGEKVPTSVDLPLSQECKRALALAGEEAEQLKHEHIESVHLLLGLMRQFDSFAARLISERGVTIEKVRIIARSGIESAGPGQLRPVPHTSGMTGLMSRMFGGHRRPDLGWMAVLQHAGRTIFLARHEADQSGSPCIETTHVLLALSHEKEISEKYLGSAAAIRSRIQPEAKPAREKVAANDLPFSEDCKNAFAAAVQQAAQLGQQAAAVHLLLGILSVENCAAASILHECGIDAAGIRAKLGSPPPSSGPEQGRDYV